MPSQREILKNILRVAEWMNESEFSDAEPVIDGVPSFNEPLFVRLSLDPWLRNNTQIAGTYGIKSGKWVYLRAGVDVKTLLDIHDFGFLPCRKGKESCIAYLVAAIDNAS